MIWLFRFKKKIIISFVNFINSNAIIMPLKVIKLGVFYGRSDEIRALNMLSGKVSI